MKKEMAGIYGIPGEQINKGYELGPVRISNFTYFYIPVKEEDDKVKIVENIIIPIIRIHVSEEKFRLEKELIYRPIPYYTFSFYNDITNGFLLEICTGLKNYIRITFAYKPKTEIELKDITPDTKLELVDNDYISKTRDDITCVHLEDIFHQIVNKLQEKYL